MRLRILLFLTVLTCGPVLAQTDTTRVPGLLEEGGRFLKANKLDQAEEDFQQVLNIYKSAGVLRLHPVYDLLAQVSGMRADLKKELVYRTEEVKSMEASKDTSYCDYHYGKLSLAYSQLGMYEFSEAYAVKAIKWLRARY